MIKKDELTDDEDIEESSAEEEGESGDYDLTDDEAISKPSPRAPTTVENLISPKSARRNPGNSTFNSNKNPKPTLKSAESSSAALRPFCNALAVVLLFALAAL